jgi:flagellar hook-length control protein FliK
VAPSTATAQVLPVVVVPEAEVPAVPTGAPSVALAGAAAAPDATPSTGTGAGSVPEAVVAPVPATSGDAPSADAGAGQDSNPDGAPAGTGPSQANVGPAPAVATAAVANVDAATGSDAALPVAAQVARQVAVLRGGPDGEHSMTLVLTPDTLGEVQVQVTVTKGAVELALRGAHEQGRAALLEALPDLRRDLEAAGLNPSRLEVARETGSSLLDRQPTQQQSFGERSGQPDRGEGRSRPWGRPADIGGSGPSTNPNRSTSSGVDVLV